MASIVLVRGDGGSKVVATLTDASGAALDLTGKSATLAFTIGSGALVTRGMTVLDQAASKGKAEYQLSAADLNASGEFEAECVINSGQADQLTSEKFRLKVRERKT